MARNGVHPDSLAGQGVVQFPGAQAPRPEPGTPAEPDWKLYFPAQANLRRLARRKWRDLLKQLAAAHVVISVIDGDILCDYVVCWIRILWLENQLVAAFHETDRGLVKSAAFSPLNQYRAQLKFYVDRLGLSPRSRQDLHQGKADDDPGLNLD